MEIFEIVPSPLVASRGEKNMRNIIQQLEMGEREQGGGENWLGENGEKARVAEICVCVCVRGTSVRTLLLRTNGIKGRRWNRITPDLESRALPFDFYRIRSQILSDVSADGQHLSNCARPLGHGGWGGGGGREPFQSPDS